MPEIYERRPAMQGSPSGGPHTPGTYKGTTKEGGEGGGSCQDCVTVLMVTLPECTCSDPTHQIQSALSVNSV